MLPISIPSRAWNTVGCFLWPSPLPTIFAINIYVSEYHSSSDVLLDALPIYNCPSAVVFLSMHPIFCFHAAICALWDVAAENAVRVLLEKSIYLALAGHPQPFTKRCHCVQCLCASFAVLLSNTHQTVIQFLCACMSQLFCRRRD